MSSTYESNYYNYTVQYLLFLPLFLIFSQLGSQSHPYFSDYPCYQLQIHRIRPVPAWRAQLGPSFCQILGQVTRNGRTEYLYFKHTYGDTHSLYSPAYVGWSKFISVLSVSNAQCVQPLKYVTVLMTVIIQYFTHHKTYNIIQFPCVFLESQNWKSFWKSAQTQLDAMQNAMSMQKQCRMLIFGDIVITF